MSRTLVAQLLRWQVAAMTVAWLCLAVWLVLLMTRFENGDLDKRMTYFAQILAETASAEPSREALSARLAAVHNVFVNGVIESLENAEHYEAQYQVLDKNGRLIYANHPTVHFPPEITFGIQELPIDGSPARVVRVHSADGQVQVVLAESLAMRRASVLPMLRIIGGGQVLIFLVCLLAVWAAARRGLAPLQLLAAQVGERKPGDLDPIETETVFSELAPLIEEMNGLLQREADRLERERQFLADAAHELRTPLAAVAAQAHLLANAESRDERATASAQLESGLKRSFHVIAQLLHLARLEALPIMMPTERIDLAELIRRRLAEFSKQARCRSVALEINGPESLWYEIDAAAWGSVIDNLVDNAIRYGRQGGTVQVSFSQTGEGVQLSVRDDGAGVPSGLGDRIFERFFRIAGTQSTGAGLGLSIVKRVCERYGASVEVGEGLNSRGLGITVRIPVPMRE